MTVVGMPDTAEQAEAPACLAGRAAGRE